MPNLVKPVLDLSGLSELPQPTIAILDVALLRPWARGDAAAVEDAYDDPAIQRWHSRRVDTPGEARELIERWQSDWSNRSGIQWALTDVRTGELLGRVALKKIDLQDGNAEVAYWMVPAARGRGLCAEAVKAASRWAFDAGFHRLHLEHSVANPASCRTAEKAGFIAEGTHRSAVLHSDGWHDMHFHGRVAGD